MTLTDSTILVSLVVILFEMTGALSHVLPIMVSVMLSELPQRLLYSLYATPCRQMGGRRHQKRGYLRCLDSAAAVSIASQRRLQGFRGNGGESHDTCL